MIQLKLISLIEFKSDISLPSIPGVGGGSGNGGSGGGPVVPGLYSGGVVENAEIGQVHKGEAVILEHLVDGMKQGNGGKTVRIETGPIQADSYAGGKAAGRGLAEEPRSHNFDWSF
ncbi:hypothetical protein [Halorussus halophilus]|uniref:hypothetical protein n=1 Tax=Halorussus halophilus TaxID=2650975 RepID=UPI001300E418|nr:hypothetical protein [Halorussus halophilus]